MDSCHLGHLPRIAHVKREVVVIGSYFLLAVPIRSNLETVARSKGEGVHLSAFYVCFVMVLN